jgi:hypothetical protein
MAGNANSGRKAEKPFRDALRIELAAIGDDQKALRQIARNLIRMAMDETGKLDAIKELADRSDGKVPQAIVGGDEDDNPVSVVTRIEIVAPSVDGHSAT